MKTKTIVKIYIITLSLMLNTAGFGQFDPTAFHTGGDIVNSSTAPIGTLNNVPLKIMTGGVTYFSFQPDDIVVAFPPGGTTGGSDTNRRHVFSINDTAASALLGVYGKTNLTDPVIKALVRNTTSGQNYIGIHAISKPANGYGYGIQSEAYKRSVYALNAAGTAATSTYAVYASSTASTSTSNAIIRYGVFGSATGGNHGIRYGIYGTASGGDSATRYAAYFQGDVTVTGTFTNPSDRKLKEKITYQNSMLQKILQLRPTEYFFKKEYINAMNLPSGKQFGFIADEVVKIFPELISDNVQAAQYDETTNEKTKDEIQFNGINYIGFVPLLIQSIKEQQEEIIALQSENELLKSQIAEINNKLDAILKTQGNAQQPIKILDEKKSYCLEQNSPNPFSQSTSIKYSILVSASSAFIKIFDHNRMQIQSFTVPVQANGSIEIAAGSLKTGEYIYELIVDGKSIDSKKMIIIP